MRTPGFLLVVQCGLIDVTYNFFGREQRSDTSFYLITQDGTDYVCFLGAIYNVEASAACENQETLWRQGACMAAAPVEAIYAVVESKRISQDGMLRPTKGFNKGGSCKT